MCKRYTAEEIKDLGKDELISVLKTFGIACEGCDLAKLREKALKFATNEFVKHSQPQSPETNLFSSDVKVIEEARGKYSGNSDNKPLDSEEYKSMARELQEEFMKAATDIRKKSKNNSSSTRPRNIQGGEKGKDTSGIPLEELIRDDDRYDENMKRKAGKDEGDGIPLEELIKDDDRYDENMKKKAGKDEGDGIPLEDLIKDDGRYDENKINTGQIFEDPDKESLKNSAKRKKNGYTQGFEKESEREGQTQSERSTMRESTQGRKLADYSKLIKELGVKYAQVAQVNGQYYGKLGLVLGKQYGAIAWTYIKVLANSTYYYSRLYGKIGLIKAKKFALYAYRKANTVKDITMDSYRQYMEKTNKDKLKK